MAAMKRNLVRLLGVLTFDNVPVGDLVRNCGGVQLLLSMTEVDEFNPCEPCELESPRNIH